MSYEDQLGRLASKLADLEERLMQRILLLEQQVKNLSVPKPVSEEHQRIRDAIANLKPGDLDPDKGDFEHGGESDNG